MYFFLWKALTVVFGITACFSPQGYSESPDLEFEYADTDKWAAELAELYSYTEGPEFLMNRKCFEEDFRIHGEMILRTSWFL